MNNANLTENAAKFVLSEECDRDYFYYFTTSTSFESQVISKTRTTTQPKLALERLGTIELPLHNKKTQKIITNKAKIINKHKETIKKIIQKKLIELNALKFATLRHELKDRTA